jgi:hypothetical protein
MTKKILVLMMALGAGVGAVGCKPKSATSTAGGSAAGGSGGSDDQKPAPVKVSDEQFSIDDDGNPDLKYDVTATDEIKGAGVIAVARCKVGDTVLKDESLGSLDKLKSGDTSSQDADFIELDASDSKPAWCELALSYSDDGMGIDETPVETLCWNGSGTPTKGACANDSGKAAGDGPVTVVGPNPYVQDSMPGVKYEITANRSIDDAAVFVTARCSADGKTKKDDAPEPLSHMQVGDTVQVDATLTNIDLGDTDSPDWCEYAFDFRKTLLDDDGQNVQTICWKGGNVNQGPCS